MADDASHDKPNSNGPQLNIELPEKLAEGIYSNLAIITHSPTEFVVDFVQVVPNVPKAKVKSRVLLSPTHARRLLKALEDNVGKYEAQFGPISEPGPANQRGGFPPMSFNMPPGQA